MFRSRLYLLCMQAWSMVLAEINAQEITSLVRAGRHSTRLSVYRAGKIVSRVRLVAGLSAILTPLWIVVDICVYSPQVWHELLPIRLVTAVAFAAIILAVRGLHTLRDAYMALILLFAVIIAYFLFIHFHMSGIDISNQTTGNSIGYAFLPFVVIAGISMFPLTLVEGAWFAAAMLVAQTVATFPTLSAHDWPAFLAPFGVLLLVVAIAMFAGLSQLSFIIVMLRESIHDGLTGCYSRRCGEELLELQYASASRSNGRLAVALVGLDNFQDVNTRFGYETGDDTLIKAAEVLHDSMRSGDMLVRWTGDQFLLILPHASREQASGALQRLLSSGLDVRPDGAPITVSIGIAERAHDLTQDWWKLVDLAESRLLTARHRGGSLNVAQ